MYQGGSGTAAGSPQSSGSYARQSVVWLRGWEGQTTVWRRQLRSPERGLVARLGGADHRLATVATSNLELTLYALSVGLSGELHWRSIRRSSTQPTT